MAWCTAGSQRSSAALLTAALHQLLEVLVSLPGDRSVRDLPGGQRSHGSQRDRLFSFCCGLAELNRQAIACSGSFPGERLVLKRARRCWHDDRILERNLWTAPAL